MGNACNNNKRGDKTAEYGSQFHQVDSERNSLLTTNKNSSNTNKDSTVCVIEADLMGLPYLAHRASQQLYCHRLHYLVMSLEVDNLIGVATPIRYTTFCFGVGFGVEIQEEKNGHNVVTLAILNVFGRHRYAPTLLSPMKFYR